ncbi:MAG: DUF4251 domain-containing protein [Prolixibacteraceae bacterium]|nr:DUF4251 domain-containing protein [Prolixibacteraceae bacterium]
MKKIFILSILLLLSAPLFSKNECIKRERHIKDSIEFADLLNMAESKSFLFSTEQVLPMSASAIHVGGDGYYVTVRNDSVFCELPFYGRAYNVNLNERGGFHFEEPIINYKLKVNNKKSKIDITIKVNIPRDNVVLHFTLTGKENSSLSVTSNNRSNISYWGDISNLSE